MKVLEDFIGTLKFGETQTFGKLTIKPLIADSDYTLTFLTLEEALAKDVLEIKEKYEMGDVPELLVINRGDQDVIVIEGEELLGAKQNRMVNATTIIPAKSEIILPVTCVERGRWHYRSEKFASGESVMYSALRKKSHSAVSCSLAADASYDSDQSEVWEDISSKFNRMNIETETEASCAALKSVARPVEKPLLDKIRHQDRQVGFLAFIDGGFAGGDLFGSSELCKKQLQKLTRGYYVDTADRGVSFPKMGESEILDEISGSDHTEYPAIGRGREIRFGNGKIQGACKVVDEQVSHLTVFPVD